MGVCSCGHEEWYHDVGESGDECRYCYCDRYSEKNEDDEDEDDD